MPEWRYVEIPPEASLEVFFDSSRQALSKNDSPDIPFTWSVNPYRGCYHGCAYCYARPTHAYWDLGAGTDFERKIIAKINAPEKLREAFLKKSWAGDLVVWDNRATMHRATPFDDTKYRRELRRVTTLDID